MFKIKQNTNVPLEVRKAIFKESVEDYKDFFLKNIDIVSEWIRDHFVTNDESKKLKGDRELAVFIAERSLLKDLMIKNCTSENLRKAEELILQFIKYADKETLDKEVGTIFGFINDNKDFFKEHYIEYRESFTMIISKFENVSREVNNDNITESLEKMINLVGEISGIE